MQLLAQRTATSELNLRLQSLQEQTINQISDDSSLIILPLLMGHKDKFRIEHRFNPFSFSIVALFAFAIIK